jgi:hypothetical protein
MRRACTDLLFAALAALAAAAALHDSAKAQAAQWLPTNTQPRARTDASLAPQPFSGRLLLIGGLQRSTLYAQATFEGDAWEWSGSRWARRTLIGPSARMASTMSLDLVRQRIVLFGGYGPGGSALADTWEFDGEVWTQRNVVGGPPASWGHALAYDLLRLRTVLFGANTGTWEWDGTAWTRPALAVAPSARSYAAMVFDPARAKLVMYGGVEATRAATILGDTWTYDGTWTQLAPNPAMPARFRHAMAHDPVRQRVFVHGGRATATLHDTWELSVLGWTPTATAHSPNTLDGAVMDFDTRSLQLVLAGTEVLQSGAEVAATWRYDGVDWVRDAAPPLPPQRRAHAFVPDAVPGGMLLFGGYSGDFAPLADTWRLDGTRWVDRTPAVTPPPRYEFQIATDRARGRVVVFGGEGATAVLGDTWEWDGTSWTQPQPAQQPPPRSRGAMAYDAARGTAVLFGGTDHFQLFGDTWTWNGTAWQRPPVSGPLARTDCAMTYDGARNEVLLFGGTTATTTPLQNDVWRWNGAQWTQSPTPAVAPYPRQFPAFAFDPQRQRAVVHGGLVVGPHGNTWEWDGVQWGQTWTATPPDWLPLAGGPNAMAFDERRGCMLLHDGDELWTYTNQPGRDFPYGTGCGAFTPLELRAASRPFLGNDNFHLLLVGAAGQQPFAVFLGFLPANTPLGGGCTAWLVPAQVWLAGVTDSFASLVHSPLPGDAALFGLTGGLQAAVLDPASSPGFAVSNGLALVLGF